MTWLFGYMAIGAATAFWTWRVLGSGLGHTPRDAGLTMESFIFWPVSLALLVALSVWEWRTRDK